jgi:hypothetical protein
LKFELKFFRFPPTTTIRTDELSMPAHKLHFLLSKLAMNLEKSLKMILREPVWTTLLSRNKEDYCLPVHAAWILL